jgi:phosphate:Na+ symporter
MYLEGIGMHFSLVLLHLSGAVLLLLYAVHLVRIGVETAFGHGLRSLLRHAQTGRLRAAAGGTVLAVLLQSSTAVAVLICGFATTGLLPVPTGLAIMLGADLGSAIVARILSFDLGWLIPVCLFLGGVLHLKLRDPLMHEVGRMILGIGFVLLSLKMVGTATAPLRDGTMLVDMSTYLADDYLTAFLIGAIFTWVIHSSVASVLMLAAFAAQGLLPLEAAVPMVFGANLGGGLIAFWLTQGASVKARRITAGNLIFRCLAALLAVAGFELGVLAPGLSLLGSGATAVVGLHVVFNAALLAAGFALLNPMSSLILLLLPEPPDLAETDDLTQRRVSVLDPSVIKTPRLALAATTRELLRMGELVEIMARPVMALLQNGDHAAIQRIREIDEEVNTAHTNIKLYLAEVNRGVMTAEEARHSIELTDFAINLEHAGDIVAKQLLALADERAEKGWQFSKAGWQELSELHHRLLDNIRLSLNVLVSQDRPSARQLVNEKERMRDLARRTQDLHLQRLQQGTPESIETSGMHLEIARGLKELNSLVVTVAYPILSRSGELLGSRLALKASGV